MWETVTQILGAHSCSLSQRRLVHLNCLTDHFLCTGSCGVSWEKSAPRLIVDIAPREVSWWISVQLALVWFVFRNWVAECHWDLWQKMQDVCILTKSFRLCFFSFLSDRSHFQPELCRVPISERSTSWRTCSRRKRRNAWAGKPVSSLPSPSLRRPAMSQPAHQAQSRKKKVCSTARNCIPGTWEHLPPT